jgi:hypothetical protein
MRHPLAGIVPNRRRAGSHGRSLLWFHRADKMTYTGTVEKVKMILTIAQALSTTPIHFVVPPGRHTISGILASVAAIKGPPRRRNFAKRIPTRRAQRLVVMGEVPYG